MRAPKSYMMKTRQTDLNQGGFSLIELMVVVTLLGILAVFALPSYQQWLINSRIRSTTESIKNGLQIARAQAVINNAQVEFILGANSDWTVGCVNPTATCLETIEMNNPNTGESGATVITPTPAGATTLTFTNLGGVSGAGGELRSLKVELSPTSTTERKLQIDIGTGGSVKMCDPSLPTTNVAAC